MVTPKENQYHQHLPQDDKPGDTFAKKINEPSFRRIAWVAFVLVIGECIFDYQCRVSLLFKNMSK